MLVSLLAAARAGRRRSADVSTVPVIVPSTDGDVPDRPWERRGFDWAAAQLGVPMRGRPCDRLIRRS